jgi:serine/threonine protein phosphatase PrpC
MKKLYLNMTSATRQNTRDFSKPNEDFLLTDEENGIFIILDGITRVHAEYDEIPGYSAAAEVNKLFSDVVYGYIKANLTKRDIRKVITDAMILGNQKIAQFRTQKPLDQWQFYPGTLGIVCVLRGRKLHYAYVGDCLGMLLRGSTKIFFGEQQTVKASDLHKPTKAERYDLYCNHPENELSYAIFNGDDTTAAGIESGWLDLYENDRVFLVSDGVAPYIRYENAAAMKDLTAQQILEASTKYDLPPYAKYADDKTAIVLQFT